MQQRHLEKTKQARKWYDEYVLVGAKQFKVNHPELDIAIVYNYFREFIPEYIPRKRCSKKRLIEFQGKHRH